MSAWILLDNHLRGAAREFALQASQIKLGYNELKENLEQRFSGRAPKREARKKFFSCRHRPGEKVKEYANRVRSLASEAESDGLRIDITEVADIFLTGLCPNLWQRAHQLQNESWEVIVSSLHQIEERDDEYSRCQLEDEEGSARKLRELTSQMARLESKLKNLETENQDLRRTHREQPRMNMGNRWNNNQARGFQRRGGSAQNNQPTIQGARQERPQQNPNGRAPQEQRKEGPPAATKGGAPRGTIRLIIDTGSEANIVNIDSLDISVEGLGKPTFLKGISGSELRSLGSGLGFDGILGMPGFKALRLTLNHDGSVRSDFEQDEEPTKSAFLSSLQASEVPVRPPSIPLHKIRTGEDVLRAYSHCFCDDISDMGDGSTIIAPKLKMLTGKPVYRRQYPIPNKLVSKVKALVDELEEAGIIEGSTSLWNSPLFPVAKTDGSVRITIDLRLINEVTEFFPFPIPRVEDNLRAFAGAKVFSTLDLTSGFFQIRIPEGDRDYFTFSLPWGRYRFTRLPQGAKNSAQIFQWAMNLVLGDLLYKCVRLYIDDVIVYSDSHEQHVADLAAVLERLSRFNLKARRGKSYFFKGSVDYLGHVIDQDGIKPMWDNVAALRDLKRAHNIRGSEVFWGRRFTWGTIEQTAFETIKQVLTSEPLLAHPMIGRPFILNTDASGIAVGACLQQEIDGVVKPIAYYSKRFIGPETRYSTIEKEAYAVVLSLQHFKHLLAGSKVEVHTDHKPITYNKGSDYKNARLSRWAEIIQDFNVTFVYVPGKENTVADFLSRFPCEDDPESSRDKRVVAAVIKNRGPPLIDSYRTWEGLLKDKKWAPLLKLIGDRRSTETVTYKNKDYKMHEDYLVSKNSGGIWVKVVPTDIREMVIKYHHDVPTGGHFGGQEGNEKAEGRLLLAGPGKPFEHLALDFIGPLEKTSRGHSSILTIVDLFTKFSILIPTRDQCASTVVKALLESVITIFGVPKTILSDRGSAFISCIFKGICKAMGVSAVNTTAWRPQSNGAVERLNRTVIESLRRCEAGSNWDDILPVVALAIRTTEHSSTGFTPAKLVFGHELRLPQPFQEAGQSPVSEDLIAQTAAFYERELTEEVEKIREVNLETGNLDKYHIDRLKQYHIPIRIFPTEEEETSDGNSSQGSSDEDHWIHLTGPAYLPNRSVNVVVPQGVTTRANSEVMRRGEIDRVSVDSLTLRRRSRRLQGLEPQENIAMIKQETQTKMGEYHFQPFRNPSIFTGERNQNPEKWLKEFHRVARYNCWDDSMCLANVYFFLQGTAHRWYENVEKKINSWDIFVKMFSQNFGHHVTQKDQLAENLKTRAQGKEETSDSYIQDVLHLCREVNPAMMENEIVAHLTKGISEEIYQSIIILDIASIDEFIKWCRKIEASNKKRVKKRVVFDRLPNVAAIDSAVSESMEDLIRRIVREEVHRALNPESTTPEPSSLKEIIREEIEKNVAAISKPIQRPPPRQSYPNQTRTFNQVPRRQYPTQTPIYNQTPPQRRTDEWRTHDNIPICFNCGRPGHVKRYCRERRQWTQRPEGHAPSTQEPQMGNHQAIRSQTYRRQSPKKLSVASSFEGEAAGVKNPPSSTAAKLQQNYVEIIIDDIAFSALVDSGSSFSVISDGLRRQLKKTMFKDSGMTLKVADGKNVTSIGRCTISLSINGLEQPLEFIVLPNSNPSIILGWDFLEASNAVIDCGRAEIRLEEAKDVLNSPASMGKVVASRSVVIPAESTKLINVMSEELNGQNQVLFEPSKKVLIGKGLTLPCALFRLSHNKGKLWIVNSSTTAQIVPKGMCLGKIQRVEENNLTAISECSESNKEVKNANHASHADKSDFKFLQNLISDDLSEEQQSQIFSILKRYDKIFDKNNESVKQTSLAKHKIETGNHQPIKHRPYRVSPTERQAIQTEVDKMLDAGIIRHSESPWSSPVILVKKKDGNWRFCVDYRRLNKVTKKDVYPLPRIDDTLDSLKGAKFYSSMDLRSGYWQIEVDEADREKTAFITPDGLYEFLVMPFGLCNAPATFERMMDKILKGLKWTMALCYLDDIVVYSKSFNEHLHRLEIILQCLDKAELRLNPKKCLFGTKRIRVFGHLVDSKGIYPDPEKIEAIAKFPTPKSITDVRSFIGLCSYYRRFIENFAEKAAPLHEVLKKDNKFMWNSDQQDAFDSLKKALMSEPVLAYFEEQLPTELHTDASGYGIGAILVQINDGKERPVGYASRTLSKAEKNYSTTERECLAAIWAINKFRPYLFGREFVIVTDHHALCWLSNLKDPTGRLARWALKLQEYNVTVVYKSGRKHQDADCLSRNPPQLESEEAYNDEDDDIPSITALTCFEAEQRKDPKICKLIKETERFGAESKGYEMLKGTLYKKNFDPLGNQHLLVIPKHLRLELLKSLHDAPTAGHLGFSKTYERVKNKYFWPGLLRDIRKYVAHCKECQRKKQSTQKPPGLLKAIPPATSPFQRVGMDLLGRFPKSDNGNKWIIVCTDYLTRFAVTKALPTGEAKEAAKFLMEDVVLKHGAPREIITDRGRVFQSKLIAELTNQCSSIHRFTTAYHPQTNGLTERLNKTLANMIAMYVSVEQKDWDVILPYVTFAYNTAKQDTTGFTPFKLIHGREAETTVDTLFPNPHEDLQEDYSQKIASRVEETRQLARLETLKAQEKDKARYDSKHEAMDYNVGDLVWIFIPIRKVGLSEKLMKRYFGPYRVTRKLSDVTFEVEPVDQLTRRRKTRDLVHVLRMKPYHDPEDQADLFKPHSPHNLHQSSLSLNSFQIHLSNAPFLCHAASATRCHGVLQDPPQPPNPNSQPDRIKKAERRLEQNSFDVEAWSILIRDAQ
ncbi:hypothetical protein LAZ67_6004008, partial [Cordylochernes scorpioides]